VCVCVCVCVCVHYTGVKTEVTAALVRLHRRM